jgi:Preprotein translocase subunit YidC
VQRHLCLQHKWMTAHQEQEWQKVWCTQCL